MYILISVRQKRAHNCGLASESQHGFMQYLNSIYGLLASIILQVLSVKAALRIIATIS